MYEIIPILAACSTTQVDLYCHDFIVLTGNEAGIDLLSTEADDELRQVLAEGVEQYVLHDYNIIDISIDSLCFDLHRKQTTVATASSNGEKPMQLLDTSS